MTMNIDYDEKQLVKIGKVFDRLKKGGTINKKIMIGINFTENPDYQLISDNQDSFKMLSATVGGCIEAGYGYYLLADRNGDPSNGCKELKSKIFILINLLANYSSVENEGIGFEKVSSSGAIEKEKFLLFLSKPENQKYNSALSSIEKKLTMSKLLNELTSLGFLLDFQNDIKLSYYGQAVYMKMLDNYNLVD